MWVLVRTASPRQFLSENVQFLEVKFSVYLNRRVFVMIETLTLHVSNCRSREQTILVVYIIRILDHTTDRAPKGLPLRKKIGCYVETLPRRQTILYVRLDDSPGRAAASL